MYDRTGNYLTVAILIGLILGVITATIFGENAVYVGFLGDIFLNALKMVVIPLLFCSIIMGIVNLGDATKLGRTGLKTVLYFLATGAIAALIGILLVNIVNPGADHSAASGVLRPAMEAPAPYSFFTWLADQVPANIFRAAAETGAPRCPQAPAEAGARSRGRARARRSAQFRKARGKGQ
jgi:Na+/H+-dicarboxylate symporter